jgi:hypothetical protein
MSLHFESREFLEVNVNFQIVVSEKAIIFTTSTHSNVVIEKIYRWK